MIVCICHRVSDHTIAREARAGCASFEALQDSLRVATACGACAECARDVFATARNASDLPACTLTKPARTVQAQAAF
jgi:bacterioferritin-associated ferredoxin